MRSYAAWAAHRSASAAFSSAWRDESAAATRSQGEADAVRAAIAARFWREDRGLYMSYIGAADGPLSILYTQTAVQIGVVYNYLPLMIMPLYVGSVYAAWKQMFAHRGRKTPPPVADHVFEA